MRVALVKSHAVFVITKLHAKIDEKCTQSGEVCKDIDFSS